MYKVFSEVQGYSEEILKEFPELEFEYKGGRSREEVLADIPGYLGLIAGASFNFDDEFSGNTIYTIIAANSVAAFEPLVLAQPRTSVSAGSARLFVAHAAAAAPEVDVYVTAPGADLAASAPVGTFEFRGTLGPVEVAAGDYQIRVTAAGDAAAVVYDSGTIPLADGNDLVVHDYVDLGIAVDLDYEGLLAPVIRDAETKRLAAIATRSASTWPGRRSIAAGA